jgi:hypothetical protein
MIPRVWDAETIRRSLIPHSNFGLYFRTAGLGYNRSRLIHRGAEVLCLRGSKFHWYVRARSLVELFVIGGLSYGRFTILLWVLYGGER